MAMVCKHIEAEPPTVPRCQRCGGIVKPKVVFFGENLPERFHKQLPDLKKADLLLVMGTSLMVHPFASLVDMVEKTTPRVLFNREPVGPFGAVGLGRNVVALGDCDSGVQKLAGLLGWTQELQAVAAEGEALFAAAQEAKRGAATK